VWQNDDRRNSGPLPNSCAYLLCQHWHHLMEGFWMCARLWVNQAFLWVTTPFPVWRLWMNCG